MSAVIWTTACGGSSKPSVDMAARCRVTVVRDGGAATENRSYDVDGRLHSASYELRGDRNRAEKRTYDRHGRLLRIELEDGDNKYAPARRGTYVEHRYEGGRRTLTNTTEVIWRSLGIGRGFESSPTVQRAIEERFSYNRDELVEVAATTTGIERTTAIDTYDGGLLIARVTSDVGGNVVSRSVYEYGAHRRRTSEAYAQCDGGACETVESVTYRYDTAGRLVEVAYERPDDSELITISYDELGRPAQEVLTAGATETVTSYGYSAACTATAGHDRIERFAE